MTLLLIVACLPASYTITTDVYDVAGECWDYDVVVTLDMKYWREWYLDQGEYCGDFEDVRPTSDGRCIAYVGCEDAPPLVDDDPNFVHSYEDTVTCTEACLYTAHVPACASPALTEWP